MLLMHGVSRDTPDMPHSLPPERSPADGQSEIEDPVSLEVVGRICLAARWPRTPRYTV